MKSLILIVITSALINNVVLNQFLGICSFLGVSKQIKASASLGVAVIFVITIASAVASLLYDYVLAPLGMDFMKTIVFILVIAALVQIVEMFLKKPSPAIAIKPSQSAAASRSMPPSVAASPPSPQNSISQSFCHHLSIAAIMPQ